MLGRTWGDRMTKWFEDDVIDTKIKKDDPELVDIEELYEEEGYSEENLKLLELGISLDLVELFKSHYKNKNIFYGDKLTKQFFEWILGSCNKDQLWLIKEHYDKYPKKFQAMIDKAEPHELGQEEPVWKSDQEELIKLASLAGTRKQYLKFLYEMLGRILDTMEEQEASYDFNEVEIDMIKRIKEDLE